MTSRGLDQCIMKDLLAVVAPVSGPKLGRSVVYAFHLARLIGAHFTAMIADIDAGSSPGQVTSNDIAETAALIRSAAARADAPCAIMSHDGASSPLRETLIGNAQVRDLVVLDVREPLSHPRKGLVEAVLFNTGRPIVLVPAVFGRSSIGTVVIAWDETPSAVRALHDALPLLKHARDVVLISVTDDKEFRAFRSGADLCQYLARWEIVACFEAVERGGRTVGAALLEHARRIDADLLVMGGFGHAREREFIVGSATRDIFQSTLEIPVLLSH